MEEDYLLRLPEVAARLALSRTAIYRLIERGEIQPVRIGSALRFSAFEINRLIETMKGRKTHAHVA